MRHLLPIGLALALAACNAEEQESPAQDATEAADQGDQAEADKDQVPTDLAGTAWRSVGEDGARYTTYLDRDGTYRDLRNGEAWQTGQWTFNSTGDGRLCFTPEAENGVERCWTPGAMKDDSMIATAGPDRRVELARAEYQLPEAPDSEGE
ncbi:hypothetical protein [Qipengyuania proteolytica]|uniref:hypothetical protein n=1 Tax=Qipengyuania proteolytica TaxID=2867239 RepID=UPI001FFCA12C|nr:hypothetical protein [Qipengyuania proteolytica]